MGNLRNLAVSDMRELNIKDWGMLIELKDPDGKTHNVDNVTGEALRAVKIQYGYRKENPTTGEMILVNEPIVTMALDSLERIPKSGEKWFLRFPIDPDSDVTPENGGEFILSDVRAVEGGRSLGFIRLYPTKVKQSA